MLNIFFYRPGFKHNMCSRGRSRRPIPVLGSGVSNVELQSAPPPSWRRSCDSSPPVHLFRTPGLSSLGFNISTAQNNGILATRQFVRISICYILNMSGSGPLMQLVGSRKSWTAMCSRNLTNHTEPEPALKCPHHLGCGLELRNLPASTPRLITREPDKAFSQVLLTVLPRKRTQRNDSQTRPSLPYHGRCRCRFLSTFPCSDDCFAY